LDLRDFVKIPLDEKYPQRCCKTSLMIKKNIPQRCCTTSFRIKKTSEIFTTSLRDNFFYPKRCCTTSLRDNYFDHKRCFKASLKEILIIRDVLNISKRDFEPRRCFTVSKQFFQLQKQYPHTGFNEKTMWPKY